MVRISNLELTKLLWENSRISFVSLAKHFGVSETAVRKRIRKLEEEGVIRKYTVEVDPKKIGLNIDALIGIDTKPERYIQTIETLKGMKEVMTLCSSSGDHMILIECWFEDSKELAEFVRSLEKMEEITRICPAVIIEKIK
ncbi:MAG: Lrp/AsnC family transcriptional regulator [Candidatus Aenigmatarchaeota archaeon]|nr:MAG: Lrp/AsnC family transcriptional regulator [Candidatus Aenigmarchaeota archaeon]